MSRITEQVAALAQLAERLGDTRIRLAQSQAERAYELEQREHHLRQREARLARVQQQQPAPPFNPVQAALTRRAQQQRVLLSRVLGRIADDQQH